MGAGSHVTDLRKINTPYQTKTKPPRLCSRRLLLTLTFRETGNQ
jgi:hypothetical protein